MPHKLEPLWRTVDEIARRDDLADVVGDLARAVLRGLGEGVVVETTLLPSVPLVQHVDRQRVARVRAVFGAFPPRSSALVQRAIDERTIVASRLGGRFGAVDPLERVRDELGAEMVTVVPILSGPRAVGFFAVFGGALRGEQIHICEALAAVAGAVLERVVTVRDALDQVRVRDASIAMLTSLTDQGPLPVMFVDERRRLIGWNASLERVHRVAYGVSIAELPFGDSAPMHAAIDDVLAGGAARLVELPSASTLVGVHPVVLDGAVRGVGVTLVERPGRDDHDARCLLEITEQLHEAGGLHAAFDVVAQAAAERLGDWVVLRPAQRVPHVAGTATAACLELSALMFARVSARSVPLAIPADELAMQSLHEPRIRAVLDERPGTALLAIPLGVQGAVVCVGRIQRDFTPDEVAFAGELARVATRALALVAENDEARARALLFDDFVGVVSRELRDRLTELVTQWFVAETSDPRFAGVRRSIGRMRESLQSLLAAAPLAHAPPRSTVDLGELVGALVVDVRPPSLLHIERRTNVRMERARVQDALAGVLRYVLERASADELVCVRVERVGNEIVVTVSRGGQGYRDADARQVFDGFWHGREEARALTLARAVFAAHGGRSWIETAENAGTAYSFALPAMIDEPRNLGEQRLAVEGLEETGGYPERPGVGTPVGGDDKRGDGCELGVGTLHLAKAPAVEVGHGEVENDERWPEA